MYDNSIIHNYIILGQLRTGRRENGDLEILERELKKEKNTRTNIVRFVYIYI